MIIITIIGSSKRVFTIFICFELGFQEEELVLALVKESFDLGIRCGHKMVCSIASVCVCVA